MFLGLHIMYLTYIVFKNRLACDFLVCCLKLGRRNAQRGHWSWGRGHPLFANNDMPLQLHSPSQASAAHGLKCFLTLWILTKTFWSCSEGAINTCDRAVPNNDASNRASQFQDAPVLVPWLGIASCCQDNSIVKHWERACICGRETWQPQMFYHFESSKITS